MKSNYTLIICLLYTTIFLSLNACNQKADSSNVPGEPTLEAEDPILELLPASHTGIDFTNTIQETFELNISTHVNTSNGGGVAVLDINNDGLQDLYFVSSSGENKLYLNEGNFKFKDITNSAGVASAEGFESAVTIADVNADGFQDIYICRGGPIANEQRRNILFINNQNNTFSNQAKKYNLDDISACMGAAFLDYDNDGDLDVYLVNYPVDFNYASKIRLKPNSDKTASIPHLDPIQEYDSDRLYRNDGTPNGNSGGFNDVSKEAGIWNFAYGLCVSIEDFNNDGWMDIYVSNDFIQPDLLYINNKNGTFTDRLGEYFKHTAQHSMGTDLSDFNNDGLFDLMCVDMWSRTNYRRKTLPSTNSQNKYSSLVSNNYFEPVTRNVLQKNNGNGTFSDVAIQTDLAQTDWSWSTLMGDIDNDSHKDIFITNGYQREVTDADFINFEFADIKAKGDLKSQYKDIHEFLKLIPQYKVRNFHFRNHGDLTFEEVSGKWLDVPASWSNGAVLADLDNDGDLDYIVNNINDPAFIYRNTIADQKKASYLELQLTYKPINSFAIGAKVEIRNQDQIQYQRLTPNRGIFSSQSNIIHFGLGSNDRVDTVIITWPDNKITTLENVSVNQLLKIDYTKVPVEDSKINLTNITMFKQIESKTIPFVHKENEFLDFEKTFLLPWSESDLGPLMDTCDFNNDGLTDVFIGNSFDAKGGLYIQSSDGTFKIVSPELWNADAVYEDHGVIFFDADNDKDKDVLVISGGYESVSPQAFQPRLYINDKGLRLNKTGPTIFPQLENVCLRGISLDFDNDGDLDIMLGGRVASNGQYPNSPKSFLLRNDNTKFTDVTESVAPQWSEVGMVTDIALINLDNDPEDEIICVGEWMPIQVFDITSKGIMKNSTLSASFQNSEGFWNFIAPFDADQDGDIDFVTGNLGLNTQYKASSDKPLKCYSSDVDGNGSLDPIMTGFEGDNEYPYVQKDVIIKQIPALKKKFVHYSTYGNATIDKILTDQQIKKSSISTVKELSSGWWENKGNQQFIFHPFPPIAQTSIAQSCLLDDFNEDGFTDILLVGNKYKMEVETGRLDAGIGCMLLSDGKGKFNWLNNTKTGIWADKDARDVAYLNGKNNLDLIVVSNNNSPLQIFKKEK